MTRCSLSVASAVRFAANRQVLIVDSYASKLQSFKQCLEYWEAKTPLPNGDKVDVQGATTQEEAWQVLETKPVEVVVTSSKLPELGDGLRFIRDIRARLGKQPLVVMWTSDPYMTDAQVKNAGGDAFFTSMSSFRAIWTALSSHLHRGSNQTSDRGIAGSQVKREESGDITGGDLV